MTIYDDVIMRTIVDLPEEQIQGLERLCRREGISRAEAVRRALAAMLAGERADELAGVFGAWKRRRTGDGRAMVERMRREWE